MKRSKNKLIVALDVDTVDHARRLIDQLRGIAGMFKVGSQLFTAAGPQIVREIVDADESVFLDLKFHDIPNTVAAAGIEAARLGVSIFNVHALGGSQMMRRTAEAVSDIAIREGLDRPAIIAVTLLTSANQDTLDELGLETGPSAAVQSFAQLAANAGLDGVVASPRETAIVRSAVNSSEFLIVTPGVRPTGSGGDDQQRITTPRDAIAGGADYIVVGRPIIKAENPARAASLILEEIEQASAAGAS